MPTREQREPENDNIFPEVFGKDKPEKSSKGFVKEEPKAVVVPDDVVAPAIKADKLFNALVVSSLPTKQRW